MHLYNVPVIQSDLRHEETIIQAANSLDYLQQVITDVFDKIDARIEQNAQRISSINKRLEIANEKVDRLSKTNKAITIYAPAKYPGNSIFADIPVTFKSREVDSFCAPDEDFEEPNVSINRDYHVKSGLDPIDHKNIQDKLKFYHVPQEKSNKFSITENLVYKAGLGNPPANIITSIDALLLFDKPENPYANYRNASKMDSSDSYSTTSTSAQMAKKDLSSKLDAAPFSISNRKLTIKKDLFYTPGLQSAPEIDLPFDLPDLPGIADDISFNINVDENQIAPSNTNTGLMLPDLPDIMNFNFSHAADTVSLASSSKTAAHVKKHDEHDSSVGFVQQQPPKMSPSQSSSIPQQPLLSSPPPPPPPLPPVELLKVSEKSPDVSVPPIPKVVEDAARSNLMEAIRHAGGKAKLRAAAPATTTTTEQQMPDKQKVYFFRL